MAGSEESEWFLIEGTPAAPGVVLPRCRDAAKEAATLKSFTFFTLPPNPRRFRRLVRRVVALPLESLQAERAPPSYEGGWLVILTIAEVIDLKDLSAALERASEVVA